jgi:hypothetical protein
MLKFRKPAQQEHFLVAQKSIGNYQNYLDDVLLPAVKQGDWDALENIVVMSGRNGKCIYFHEDKWDFTATMSKSDAKELPTSIYFTKTESSKDNSKGKGKELERNLCNQIKCVALCMLYGGNVFTGDTLARTMHGLVKMAKIMLHNGYNDFGILTTELIKGWAQTDPLFTVPKFISELNKLLVLANELPFSVNFDLLTSKRLNVVTKAGNQNYVIPPRIYKALLNQYTAEINELLPHFSEVEAAIEGLISLEQRFVTLQCNKIRTGEKTLEQTLSNKRWVEEVREAFDQAGVELVDNCTNTQWHKLFSEIAPTLKASPHSYFATWRKKPFIINGNTFNTVGALTSYLDSIDAKCKTICLALSGMRGDELHSMTSQYGAQKEIIKGQIIHVFTTRQSKITVNSQTKNDIFVTTQNGHNAFELLRAIHRPYRRLFNFDKNNMFANLHNRMFPRAATKSSWMTTLQKYLLSKDNGLDLVLSNEDMKYLDLSNPERDTHKEYDKFHVSLHQFRRSFAYYLIGFELLAFPHLKKQLSHLSMAMTLHYANNATSFQKLYGEISKERARQQAEVLAKVYQRLANNERVAGGKGKALQKIAGDGKNYFEAAENKRKLDPNYWQRLISDEKIHIHAIAPSMYCTNSACSMRMNIELAECIDCEFDIIENAMYAEGVRMNASKNLLLLEEAGELTASVMSQYAVKIRSAEKIMTDLAFDFEPFQFPQSVLDAQIGVVNI